MVANSSVLFRNILFRVKKLRVFNLKNYLIWRTWIISQLLFGISYPISNPSLLNKSYRFWQFRNISLICFVCDTFCSFSELPKSARFMRIRLKSLLGPHRTGQNTDVIGKSQKRIGCGMKWQTCVLTKSFSSFLIVLTCSNLSSISAEYSQYLVWDSPWILEGFVKMVGCLTPQPRERYII